MASPQRDVDIAVMGATGFTGALTAEYLAANAPDGLRWAIAGRNKDKLAELSERFPAAETIVADSSDEVALRGLAESARVVISTVGPYLTYGEPLVAACAAAGTDYVDLTGEPEFVDRMYLRHHETAVRTGARLVHACGFDSIPHDLGAQFTVEQLPEGEAIRLRGYVSAGGTLSGGTFSSAVNQFARFRQVSGAHKERRRAEPRPEGRRVRIGKGRPGYDRSIGKWVAPMPTIDPQVVSRSAAALDRYGPDFSYSHFLAVGNPLVLGGVAAAVGGTFALAQLPPTRAALLRLRPSGAGPTAEQREKGWFRVRFVGESDSARVVTEVRGGDPGYGETSKMLAESALCLAFDNLPETAGQVTTAVAMGRALRERLQRHGVSFEVLDA